MFNSRMQGPPPPPGAAAVAAQAGTQESTIFLAKVFNWMAIGLGLTGVVAYITASTALYEVVRPIIFLLFIAEIGMVFFLSARIQKLSASTATAIFLGYALLNGLTLSTILLMYTMESIAATFFITAGMFGSMAVYGFVTKKDLSSMGSFMFMGLIGIVIASVVNIFIGSSMLSWLISGIGVIVFTGLTAYDVQKISQMGAGGIMQQGDGSIRKMVIMGALTLYLDFINLFIMLLHFFGGSRD